MSGTHPEPPPLPASLAERYVLERRLAVGGSAEVWAGTDRVLGRPIAVKSFHHHLLADDAFRTRLTREARTAATLSHPGIVAIYETLASLEGRAVSSRDDREIWTEALEGTDSIALAALDRFCLALGAVAGDFALAQGAKTVVIAGGLGYRIKDKLLRSGFDQRFVAKGRFQSLMARIPVKLITHPQPGLFGAAAAFAQEHS